MNNILLLYPNRPLQYSLPHSIASLSACLKQVGNNVSLFDTTMYKNGLSDDEKRVERGQVKPFEIHGLKTSDMKTDFQKAVDNFNPDAIFCTCVDGTTKLAEELLNSVSGVQKVVGGIGPIMNPKRYYRFADLVWTGSGEAFILGVDDINSNPIEDFTVFPKQRLYRPMSGQYFKTIPMMLDRGCPYSCTFCCAPSMRERFGYQMKSMERIEEEFDLQIDVHNPEFIYFSSESFLVNKVFDEFAMFYKEYVGLPFWCQTHVSTLSEEKVKALSSMGCHRVSLGVECGNEEYRATVVKKFFSNDEAISAVKLLSDYGINAAINNIIGFPMETESMIQETISLNKRFLGIMPDIQINGYIFQPFHGTELRQYCIDNKLLFREPESVQGNPCIRNPFMHNNHLIWLRDNFNRLVNE
jgi:radical SAM superfamily enzyme YgiQ (UPF0313 family)